MSSANGLLRGSGAPKAWMRRRAVILTGVVAAVFLAFNLTGPWDTGSASSRIPTAQASIGDVRITIVETGELRAANQATISAPTDKTVTWLAPEGSRVKAGDPLVRFESEKYVIAKQTARSSLAVAVAARRRAEGDLASQRANEQKARLKYQSLPELAKKGFITQNELQAERFAFEEVQARTGSFVAAVEGARASVEHAENELAQHDRRLRQGTVHAPRDGVVVYAIYGEGANARKVSVGMLPFEGMDLMYLPNPASMRAETEIAEQDLARVSVGTSVDIELQAYPNLRFPGRIERIGALARQKISRVTGQPLGLKVFDVSVEVLSQDERLRPGLTTTLEILVSEHADAVYLPLSGIFVDELDRTVVYRKVGSSFERKPVALGGTTNQVAIIEGGLAEGEEVALVRPESQ